MRGRLRSPGLALALVLVAGCSSGSVADFLYHQADTYRGGALYDTWWKVAGVKEAIEPGVGRSSFPGGATWRCAKCHGWDASGISGSRDKSVDTLFAIIRDGKSAAAPEHAYGEVLADTDIADLVRFIREGVFDLTTLVDAQQKAIGSAKSGKTLYDGGCAACHGPDGKKINFKAGLDDTEFLPNVAHGDPGRFVHKLRFGQPDGKMPNGSAQGYQPQDVGDLLAYAQSLAPRGLEQASAVRGGLLYDTWWKVNGAPEPVTDNALYLKAGEPNSRRGSQTWRCSECHGWDYLGKDGVYGSGSHKTGFPGILGREIEVSALTAIISRGKRSDGTIVEGHAFEGKDMLSARDVADLSYFILSQLVDTTNFISPATNKPVGDATLGASYFAASCATCHGSTGMRIDFALGGAARTAETIGDLARGDPWKTLHKIRFGQPASAARSEVLERVYPGLAFGRMPNYVDAQYSTADVAALLAFAATLPAGKQRGRLPERRPELASRSARGGGRTSFDSID